MVYVFFMAALIILKSVIGYLKENIAPIANQLDADAGWLLHNQVPWITGFGFFQTVLIAAVLPDGQALYGMASFTDRDRLQFSIFCVRTDDRGFGS
jgi:hypothetical protein